MSTQFYVREHIRPNGKGILGLCEYTFVENNIKFPAVICEIVSLCLPQIYSKTNADSVNLLLKPLQANFRHVIAADCYTCNEVTVLPGIKLN